MRVLMLCATVLSCLLLAACTATPMHVANDAGWNHYGADHDQGAPIALGAVADGARDVIVEGTIVDVCSEKGCWMVVRDGDQEIFVRFKDYGFFVPRNAAGHRVVMRGSTKLETVSVAALQHYAEDAGKSPSQIAAITAPEERITLYADSVYIEGHGLDAPHQQ